MRGAAGPGPLGDRGSGRRALPGRPVEDCPGRADRPSRRRGAGDPGGRRRAARTSPCGRGRLGRARTSSCASLPGARARPWPSPRLEWALLNRLRRSRRWRAPRRRISSTTRGSSPGGVGAFPWSRFVCSFPSWAFSTFASAIDTFATLVPFRITSFTSNPTCASFGVTAAPSVTSRWVAPGITGNDDQNGSRPAAISQNAGAHRPTKAQAMSDTARPFAGNFP